MCKPADIRTLRPGGTNTSLDWTGRRRSGFTWRIAIRNGSDGRESARILGRRLQRWFRFGGRCGDWRDSLENYGERKLICVTWMSEVGWACATRTRSRLDG